MPSTKSEERVIFDEPIDPYPQGNHPFRRWRRVKASGNPKAKWYPEDDEGVIYPYECFQVIVEAGGNHELEVAYSNANK